MRRALVLPVILLACGSPPELPKVDTDPPQVFKVDPRGTNVSTASLVTVQFTEAMDAKTITADHIALVRSDVAQEDSDLAAQVDSPPINATAKPKFVPAEVTLSDDGTMATLKPLVPQLDSVTAYTVLVSKKVTDRRHNALVDTNGVNRRFQHQFSTGVAPDLTPPAPSLPELDGQINVPVDLSRLTVLWDEPATTSLAPGEALYLEELPALVALKGTVEPQPGYRAWTLTLRRRGLASAALCPDGSTPLGEANLCPTTQYAVVLRGFRDAANNATVPERLSLFRFTTADCLDRRAPVLDFETVLNVRDTSAVISWYADERSSGRVEYATDPAFDSWTDFAVRCARPSATCGTISGPVGTLESSPEGEVDPCGPGRSAAYYGNVSLGGLAASTQYSYRVMVVDPSGNTSPPSAIASFTSRAPLPKIVLSEMMANPLTDTQAGQSQEQAEYLELYNNGAASVSLAGWFFGRSTSTTRYLVLSADDTTDGGGLTLPPGGYGLLVGKAFVPSRYNLPGATVLLHAKTFGGSLSNSLLGTGLSSSSPPGVDLYNGEGSLVSSMGKDGTLPHSTAHNECKPGVSIERTGPAAGDLMESFVCANGNVSPGASPGAANGGW